MGTLKNQVADAKEDDAKRSSKQREAVASYQQDYQVDRLVCMCTSKMLLLPAGSAGVSVCCGHFLLVICGKRAFPAPHRDYCNFNFAVIFKKNRFFLFLRFRVRTPGVIAAFSRFFRILSHRPAAVGMSATAA